MNDRNEYPEMTHSEHPPATHEKTDAHARPVFWFLIGLSILIVVSLVTMALMFNYLESWEAARDQSPSPLADPNPVPPEPRLDTTPRGQLDEVLEDSRRQLQGYGWIDKEAGVVRIPIDRAMEVTLEKGLPVRREATSLPEGED